MTTKKGKQIAYNDLENKIINSGFCTFCGACEAACPVHAITINEYKVEGIHKVTWDSTNDYGIKVSSGVYFYQLRLNEKIIDTKKMLMMK